MGSLGKREKYILLEVHDLNKITIKEFDNESNLIISNLKNISLSCDLSFLNDFFKKINPNLIHINSFAGLDWNTHGKLLDFFSNSNLNYKYTLHDYSSMCDNHTLLSPSFDYHGIPTLDERKVWEEINLNNNNNINSTNPYERKEKYSQFFKNCNLIESPSNRAKEIVLYDFPNLNINVVSFDNILTNIKPALRKKLNNKIKVSLIGCLSLHKGVKILNSLAEDNINRKLDISYSLIGYSSPFYEKNLLKNGVFITGKYENDFICCDKIKEISPDLIFISSICEETYSYTLSVALTLKIPIIVFNIGAQAERTKDIDWVVKLDPLLMKNTIAISDIIKKLDIDLLWDRASSNTLMK